MAERGRALQAHAQAVGVRSHWLDLSDEYDVKGCYDLVREVLLAAAPQRQLRLSDLAADITGGTKPMTAAMVLACIDVGADVLEHVPTYFVRGGETRPLKRPIQVTVTCRQTG